MEGRILLRSLKLQNILSYGSQGVEIELQPLNVLVGANGSGKSNFLEVLRLLKACPSDLTQPIIQGGGINEWLWKGLGQTDNSCPRAAIHVEMFDNDNPAANKFLFHTLEFGDSAKPLYVTQEKIDVSSKGIEARNIYSKRHH